MDVRDNAEKISPKPADFAKVLRSSRVSSSSATPYCPAISDTPLLKRLTAGEPSREQHRVVVRRNGSGIEMV